MPVQITTQEMLDAKAGKKPSNYDEVMDEKLRKKEQAAYDAAGSTPANPAPLYMTKTPGGNAKRMADGGSVTKTVSVPLDDERDVAKIHAKREKERSRRLPEASPKNAVYGMDASQDQSYKKGGSVSSASSRADGCATKGKTRGTMITMKGGGYAC